MKSQEMTITTLCTEDAPNIQQVILNSLIFFLKKELHNIANLSHHSV